LNRKTFRFDLECDCGLANLGGEANRRVEIKAKCGQLHQAVSSHAGHVADQRLRPPTSHRARCYCRRGAEGNIPGIPRNADKKRRVACKSRGKSSSGSRHLQVTCFSAEIAANYGRTFSAIPRLSSALAAVLGDDHEKSDTRDYFVESLFRFGNALSAIIRRYLSYLKIIQVHESAIVKKGDIIRT
jgi:hypothetical protein